MKERRVRGFAHNLRGEFGAEEVFLFFSLVTL